MPESSEQAQKRALTRETRDSILNNDVEVRLVSDQVQRQQWAAAKQKAIENASLADRQILMGNEPGLQNLIATYESTQEMLEDELASLQNIVAAINFATSAVTLGAQLVSLGTLAAAPLALLAAPRNFRTAGLIEDGFTNSRAKSVLEKPSTEGNCVLWAKDAVGAYLIGGELTVVARGVLPSASHSIRIERSPSPGLEFTLLVCGPSDNPPTGMVEEFVQFASFFNVGHPERISIRHAGGREKIPVIVEPILEPGPVPVEDKGPVQTQGDSRHRGQHREAIGYSNAFDFGEAFQNAIDNLPPDDGSTVDRLTQIEAIRIGAQFGGIAGFNRMFVVARDTSLSLGRGLQAFFNERDAVNDGDTSAPSTSKASESASIFEPSLSLVREDDGTYTLYAVIVTPNSCHRATGTEEGVPSGHTTIPEAVPVQLNIEKRQDICLDMLWPVFHKHTGIILDEAHTSVIAFTVLDGEVVGQNSIDRSDAIDALDFSKMGLTGF